MFYVLNLLLRTVYVQNRIPTNIKETFYFSKFVYNIIIAMPYNKNRLLFAEEKLFVDCCCLNLLPENFVMGYDLKNKQTSIFISSLVINSHNIYKI